MDYVGAPDALTGRSPYVSLRDAGFLVFAPKGSKDPQSFAAQHIAYVGRLFDRELFRTRRSCPRHRRQPQKIRNQGDATPMLIMGSFCAC